MVLVSRLIPRVDSLASRSTGYVSLFCKVIGANEGRVLMLSLLIKRVGKSCRVWLMVPYVHLLVMWNMLIG